MTEGDRDRWTAPLLKEHVDEILAHDHRSLVARLAATDARLDRILEGFPQSYAVKADVEKIREAIEAIRVDHVRRRELDDVKEAAIKARDDLAVDVNQLRGLIAAGPRELARLIRDQAVAEGRQRGIGVTSSAVYAILTVLIAIGALIATALIATHHH